nr:hypothetical protein B0A51_13842 [Rachicladosporium sp. CCFEE 5018]
MTISGNTMDDDDTMNPTENKEHHTPAAHDYGMRNSSLHTLPAELRNHIWELVFDNLWETTTIALSRTERHLGGSHNFALLLTCKQVNREAHGFAWRDVKASVGRDDRPILNLEDVQSTFEDVEENLKLFGSQLGFKVKKISELMCHHKGMLNALAKFYWNESVRPEASQCVSTSAGVPSASHTCTRAHRGGSCHTATEETMGINWEYSGICVTHVKSGTALQYTDRSDWDVQWV